MQDLLYHIGHERYYTEISRIVGLVEYKESVLGDLPGDWDLLDSDIWLNCFPNKFILPSQGFKIHISSIEKEAIEAIGKISAVCVSQSVPFKVIKNNRLHFYVNSKIFPRSGSGKFATIYPRSLNEFKLVIDKLYESMKGFSGPYILSDKRYLDSKVIYYRYGGFERIEKSEANGFSRFYITSDKNELVEDKRNPYYYLPEWVAEPFKNEDADEDALLNNRYEISSAIHFTNSGGVYEALDTLSNLKVIIKEARPFINFLSINNVESYTKDILKKEHSILKTLSESKYYPSAVDFFDEWEHSFLVEEFIEGIVFRNIGALPEFTLVPYSNNKSLTEKFKQGFAWIAKECISAIKDAHRLGVVLVDISPNNIIIDDKKKRVFFIDFDCAHYVGSYEKKSTPIAFTPGFGDLKEVQEKGGSYSRDWYSLAMVLYSLIIPVQEQFDINKNLKDNLLKEIVDDCELDNRIKLVISALAEGHSDQALRLLSQIDSLKESNESVGKNSLWDKLPEGPSKFTISDIRSEVNNLAYFIKNGVILYENENFLPLDIVALSFKYSNLAYGAYGAAVFCKKVTGSIPAYIEKMLDFDTDTNTLPGIFLGSAGMCLSEIELGRLDLAKFFAERSYNSEMFSENNSFAHGLAGIGFMSLVLYKKTGIDYYLNKALSIGSIFMDRSYYTGEFTIFLNSKGEQQEETGIAYGNAGISLFLLNLHKFSGEPKYLNLAQSALDYELIKGSSDDKLHRYTWGRSPDSKEILPYWEYGSAGIGAVILRFFEETKDDKYLHILDELLINNYSKYSVASGVFNGLSGLGELLIDSYIILKNEKYLDSARHIADSVMLFSVQEENGSIYPGRHNVRLSTDFAFGSSGVGLFLNRLTTKERRWIHDV